MAEQTLADALILAIDEWRDHDPDLTYDEIMAALKEAERTLNNLVAASGPRS